MSNLIVVCSSLKSETAVLEPRLQPTVYLQYLASFVYELHCSPRETAPPARPDYLRELAEHPRTRRGPRTLPAPSRIPRRSATVPPRLAPVELRLVDVVGVGYA
jgi:hypothetical protein